MKWSVRQKKRQNFYFIRKIQTKKLNLNIKDVGNVEKKLYDFEAYKLLPIVPSEMISCSFYP